MAIYLPGIPLATDAPSQSQGQLKDNFTALDDIFDLDHVKFSAAAGNGEHKKVTINDVQAVDPPLVGAPKAMLYTKVLNGHPELFFVNDSERQQLSGFQIFGGVDGYLKLPKFMIQWGILNATNAWALQTFPTPFPTHCYSITGSPISHSDGIGFEALTVANFRVKISTSAASQFYFFAVGD